MVMDDDFILFPLKCHRFLALHCRGWRCLSHCTVWMWERECESVCVCVCDDMKERERYTLRERVGRGSVYARIGLLVFS